ncbi:hypothetical protein ACGFH8_00525 [Micromonospora sp. NPDC049175]
MSRTGLVTTVTALTLGASRDAGGPPALVVTGFAVVDRGPA